MRPTEAELQKDKEDASAWAASYLADPDTVYIDTETTGILSRNPDTEIVQIAITNWQGRPLLVSMIKPTMGIPEEVSNIHGITEETVAGCPTFTDIFPLIRQILRGKNVIVYNADFDWKLLATEVKRRGEAKLNSASVHCAMDQYARWVGEWSDKKSDYKWQKLPNLSGRVAHDAHVDCDSLHLLLQKMANLPDEQSNLSAEEIDLDF